MHLSQVEDHYHSGYDHTLVMQPLLSQPEHKTRLFFRFQWDDKSVKVYVCGDVDGLGNWDPVKALQLITYHDIYPCWVSKNPVEVPLNKTIEYKYFVEKNNHIEWEELENNRVVLPSGQEMTCEDDDGLFRDVTDRPASTTDGEDCLRDLRVTEEEELQQKLKLIEQMGRGPASDAPCADARIHEGHNLDHNDTILHISFKLPVKVTKKKGGWDIMRDHTSVLPAMHEYKESRQMRLMFFGWPGVYVSKKEEASLKKELLKYDCIPVFQPEEEFEEYLSFCNRFLWPVFHDVLLFFQSANPPPFPEKQWAIYQRINKIYAERVISHSHESDLFWVHDLHLLLLPQFITRKIRRANIGLFLQTPFPSHEIFRCLPVREEMLRAMLCADLIGFQFFKFAQKFIVSCKRLLGLELEFSTGGFYGVEYSGRRISFLVSHECCPHQEITHLAKDQEIQVKAKEIRARYPNRKIFASHDSFQNLAGLMLKVRAFSQYLEENPEAVGKTVFIQYAVQTFTHHEDDERNRNELTELVDRINGKYEQTQIELTISTFARESRIALFRATDVLWDMALGNGMNLNPFEYCVVQKASQRTGVVIVSDFSGCATLLQGAIKVNPWNTEQVVEALKRAASLPKSERLKLLNMDVAIATRSSHVEWINFFIEELYGARKKEDTFYVPCGFGGNYRLIGMDQSFRRLEVADVLQAYKSSKNRFFVFDYEGTLAADVRKLYRFYGAPRDVDGFTLLGQPPDDQLLDSLRTLCKDKRNHVLIVSGRNQETLEEWFGDVKDLSLCAEHGFHYKVPKLGNNNQWYCLLQQVDTTWKTITFEIMSQYMKRTQGSFIENKGSALVWLFRDADPDFGIWQAKELSQTLTDILFGFPVEVLSGKGYVEVKLCGVNKGQAVSNILTKVQHIRGDVDFVLCFGDDRTDEDMFDVINHFSFNKSDEDLLSSTDCGDVAEEGSDGSNEFPSGTADEIPPLPQRLGHSRTEEIPRPIGVLKSSASSIPSRPKLQRGQSEQMAVQTAAKNVRTVNYPATTHSHSNLAGLASPVNAPPCFRRFMTCTVGRKPTHARFYVDDIEDVNDILVALKLSGRKRNPWSNADTFPGRFRTPSRPGLSDIFPGECG